MAATSHQLFVYDNGRKIKESKALEVIVTAIAVSADGGVTNTLTIKEGAGGAANTFDFGAKVLGNIASGTAAGQALSYSQRGAASGVASLDSGGKVPVTELPNSIMEYQGTYDPTANSGAGVPALANGTGNAGDVYKVTAAGSHDFGAGALAMVVGDYVIYSGAVWQVAHSGADAVISVNGKSGAVSLNTDDIAEGTTNKYFSGKITDNLTEGTTNKYFASGFAAATTDGLSEGTVNKYFSGKTTDNLPEGSVNKYFTGVNNYAPFINKDVDAITTRQFVKMTVAGEVTKLTSTDAVADETFFACAKDATVAADGTANFYLPEMGVRVSGFSALDVTKLVYAHGTTAGSYTQTRPTTGKVIILGKPVSATEIVFLGRFEAQYV